MRHNRQTHRLGRTHTERKALLEGLVTNLLKAQAIKTTVQKAKAAQRLADKVISLGKKDSLAARRQVFSYLQDRTLTTKLFKDVAPRFKDRQGGYTRILRLGRRKGDGADLALLELTEKEIIVKAAPKSKAKKEEKTHDHTTHEHGHEHAHEHHGHEADESSTPKKRVEAPKPDKTQGKGFLKNIGKFFRNKGGS
jgi:large subunit ribosomal protein L17